MAWQVTQMPWQPMEDINSGKGSDWFAWLKSSDGIHVQVQIGFQATQERANEIVAEFRWHPNSYFGHGVRVTLQPLNPSPLPAAADPMARNCY